jgi:hypothetical protein
MSDKKSAEKRASEMFEMPGKNIPELAQEYRKELILLNGGCAEVILHAFKVYAMLVEGLPSEDSYMPTITELAWFEERKARWQTGTEETPQPETPESQVDKFLGTMEHSDDLADIFRYRQRISCINEYRTVLEEQIKEALRPYAGLVHKERWTTVLRIVRQCPGLFLDRPVNPKFPDVSEVKPSDRVYWLTMKASGHQIHILYMFYTNQEMPQSLKDQVNTIIGTMECECGCSGPDAMKWYNHHCLN